MRFNWRAGLFSVVIAGVVTSLLILALLFPIIGFSLIFLSLMIVWYFVCLEEC